MRKKFGYLFADLAGMKENEAIASLYKDFNVPASRQDVSRLVVAYMSVGAWGCDSDAFIVYKAKNGKFYEVHGSHCSCYGFEGQWEPELVEDFTVFANRSDYMLAGGGYDDDQEKNAIGIRRVLAFYA